MLTSKMIKEAAFAAGADLCGIAPISRMAGAPDEMNPRFLFPKAKSCIALAFRIPRGVQRGIEEGTQFYQYPSMAYGGLNEIYMPAVLYKVGKVIEDEGYEAVVYRNTGARGVVSDMDGSPGNTISPEEQIEHNKYTKSKAAHHRTVQFTRPAEEGKIPPDLQFHFRLLAVACGLGEIGWSKMLLTPEFGPLQRLSFIFTDAEVEYDEMYSGEPLCRKCGACVRECPGGCIPPINSGKSVTIDLAGKKCEWGDSDAWRCYAFYTYPGRHYDPFIPKEVFDKNENGSLNLLEGVTNDANEKDVINIYNSLDQYFPSWVGYNMAKCGGCIRACVSILEKKGGCLEGKFKNPLRTQKAWKMDR